MGQRGKNDDAHNKGGKNPGGDVVSLRPFSIGTAARLAGLAPSVVRMWEVRYDFLSPDRTAGGHRLYSDDDVGVLRAVKKLLDAGLRIGAIARMPRDAIISEAAKLAPFEQAHAFPGSTALFHDRGRLIEEILAAAREFDGDQVASLLDRPRLLVDGADVVLDLYLPLLVRAGDLWHNGELPVAAEHFVEKLVTARLHAVLSSTPAPAGGRLALLACAPKERHEGGLLAAAILLKRGGFTVANLGADLPVEELVASAVRAAPAVIVMSVTVKPAAAVADALAHALRRAPLSQIPLVVGGPSSAEITSRLGARAFIAAGSVANVAADAQRAMRSLSNG